MKKTVFHVAEMCCPTEEQLIRNRLRSIEGVEHLEFNLLERELAVAHRLADETEILSVLQSLGMEATLRTPPSLSDRVARGPAATSAAASRPSWVPLAISGLAAAAAEVAAWMTGAETSALVIGLAALSLLSGGRDMLRKGLVALRSRALNINFLMSLAVIGALSIGQWPEAAMVTFLFALAEEIESHSLDRARNAIRALMELTPETATVRDEHGRWRELAAASVQVGQMVRVRPGERIPLDGVVTAGRSSVNQAPITGESVPVEKTEGDAVFAGTVNERGSFEFRVTADQGHTTLDRIVRSVQEAQSKRAPTQRFVDRFAHYYTPGVVILAVFVAAVPPLLFDAPFATWLYRALVLLVIACPCALVISTPVTVVSGLAAAARRGILVKGGAYLEEGHRLKAMALDKTGTLTHGRPVVTDVIPLDGRPAETLLRLAASLDAHSEHPVASAIVAKWNGADFGSRISDFGLRMSDVESEQTDAPARSPNAKSEIRNPKSRELLPVVEFEAISGRGAKGRIDGSWYYVGNHRLAREIGVCAPAVEAALERLEREGKSTVVLSFEHEPLAVFGVADTLRETSVEALHSLHRLGIRTVMLTGDNETTARTIAAAVGIDDVRDNLLPEEKLGAVTALVEQYGAVGMVGDGINDAPALARASIGFAMGAAGTDTALETADVALMEDDLRKLPVFLALSRRTSQILTQNIALAIGIKAVFFALALAGAATLWMAVFADMGASLLVVFNGLRILRFGAGGPPVSAPARDSDSAAPAAASSR